MPQALQDSPAVLYVLLVVFILKLVSDAFPNVLGPISRAIHETAAAKRRAAADRRRSESARDDADIADLKRQIEILTSARADDRRVLDEMRASQKAHEHTLMVHDQWDLAVLNDPSHAQRVPRPPLYPVRETPTP